MHILSKGGKKYRELVVELKITFLWTLGSIYWNNIANHCWLQSWFFFVNSILTWNYPDIASKAIDQILLRIY